MSKRSRSSKKESAAVQSPASKEKYPLCKRGKIVIAAGVALVALGFWLLTFVDPAGQNWAGTVSPAVILLGYALIGIGIMLPEPVSASDSPSSPQS
jgi:dipeptide/tripeptide permease